LTAPVSAAFHPRGPVALSERTATGLRVQLGAVLATANSAVISTKARADALADIPHSVAEQVIQVDDAMTHKKLAADLVEGDAGDVVSASRLLAERSGAIVSLQSATSEALAVREGYILDWLLEEVSTSVNTSAAGGNASLMAVA
jgi:RHH-type proline utilization regulon transcriptional repressor/proline dehydrogenase/delta 1-pyrroline-5-carboxylate dehydrogenase